MQIGMIGLGRMGANMALRLNAAGQQCIGYDPQPVNRAALTDAGITTVTTLTELVAQLQPPRAIWLMVPAGLVTTVLAELTPLLTRGDSVIDGGNSHYQDASARAQQLAAAGLHFIDVGTSGGVWGRERGYCLMIGGELEPVTRLTPIFAALAPGRGDIPPMAGAIETAVQGYLHCGPSGAGHFVKMIHNGIEYALMAAYAEGFNLLQRAGIGNASHTANAETAPLTHPAHYQYEFDLAAIAELWRRGSVVSSWLLDLTAAALAQDGQLTAFSGRVADSGEGRWTALAAIETGTPTPVLTAALYDRFLSQDAGQFAHQLLSAMRYQFGGHAEQGRD